jgi:hypothetical protein
LEEVAVACIAEGKLLLAQELRNLKLREKQWQEARQIKFVLKPTNRKGLSDIEVQDQSGQWVELTKQEDIEGALLQE